MHKIKLKKKLFLLFQIFILFHGIAFAQNPITIASFNLKVFGTAKAEKPAVIKEIAEIIRKFDIVAVQEIRDKSGNAAEDLLKEINNENSTQYEMILGPRLGRTKSKEQYAFFYRNSTVMPLGAYSDQTCQGFRP